VLLHKQRTITFVSARGRSACIVRIDANNISNSLQIDTLIDLNSREVLSGGVRDIWGDGRVRESIRKLVRVGATCPRFVGLQPHVLTFLIAPTIQSHGIWNLWQEWEVGKLEVHQC